MNQLTINEEKTIAISFHHPQKVQHECPSIQLYDGNQIHRSFKIFGSLAGQESKIVYTYAKTSKQVM
jgi:hypothetical protein